MQDKKDKFALLAKKYGSLPDAASLRSELNWLVANPGEEDLGEMDIVNVKKDLAEIREYLALGEEA